jgi:hypothetical protein
MTPPSELNTDREVAALQCIEQIAEPSFDLRPFEPSFRRDPFAAAWTTSIGLALGDEEDYRFRIWLCQGAVRIQGQGKRGGSSGQNQTDGPHGYPPTCRRGSACSGPSNSQETRSLTASRHAA